MRKIFLLIAITSVFLGLIFPKPNFALAEEKIELHFFYSITCPFCKQEEEFLKELEKKYPEIEIKEYEILHHPENVEILKNFYEKYQVPTSERGRVPVVFTPNKYFVGFNQQVAENIENCLKECLGGEEKTS